ncbi:pyridoxal-phosphate dependent enzyme [Paenibacillus mesophilus]|uniref:pyridoxal-phosphate dependent enzyme n=1 Tax=Paenibacillus mesophilus TaxID=2582849 RepID=UPI001EE47C0E|nr:pyridoxal-phosphate dependent enzyme [Paenibacillus mesophilus]
MIVNILETIGNTPLITLPNSNKATEGQILLKYERFNPGGSIKDRAAMYIVSEAERRGLLKPGGTIIESSSGNFGISLAMIVGLDHELGGPGVYSSYELGSTRPWI